MSQMFKKSTINFFLILCVLLTPVLLSGCVSQIPSSNHQSDPNPIINTRFLNSTVGMYSINTTVPIFTGKIMTYSVEKPDYTREQISTLAKRLGLSDDIRENEGSYYLNASDETKFYFAVDKNTSSLSFQNLNGGLSENLTDIEVTNLVKEFLKNSDLLPSDTDEINIVRNNGQIAVAFSRNDKELPVLGSTLMVNVGSQGKIVLLFMKWPEYSPYKKVSLKTPEQAFEEFQTKKLYFIGPGMPINPEKIFVTRISLVYSETNRKYLAPTYLFIGYGQQGETKEEFNPIEIPASSEVLE